MLFLLKYLKVKAKTKMNEFKLKYYFLIYKIYNYIYSIKIIYPYLISF